jgi:hypothetical protein
VAGIAAAGSRAYLDLPGNPVEPGCGYARDFAALADAGRAPPVTYARIVRQPGRAGLVLQYWFFYWFNQFNDLHEADWEGMQIVFPAGSAREALGVGPAEIGLGGGLQHRPARADHENAVAPAFQQDGRDAPVERAAPGRGAHGPGGHDGVLLGRGRGLAGDRPRH